MRQVASAFAFLLAGAVAAAQPSFDDTIKQLSSPDTGTRLRTVQLLKETAYLEAAVPLAPALVDPDDGVQLEAIAAELNIFLAEKIVPRKRIGYVLEVRNTIAAEQAFSAGPAALGPRAVPKPVLSALIKAMRDDNPRVGVEALYAFGTLAIEPSGAARQELLRTCAPELVSMVAAPDPALRYASLRVIGRVFAARRGDDPIDVGFGDGVMAGLNDRDAAVRVVTMEALGAMRYGRAVQALTELFPYYGRGAAAEAALDALALVAHPSSAPLFVQQLATKNTTLKVIAIEGLARVGDNTAVDAIRQAASADRREGVQLAAAFADTLLDGAPIDAVAAALRRPKQHDQARGYLVEIAPGRTTALARYLQDSEPRTRAEFCDIFAAAGDPAAVPAIEPLLRDPDAQVALAAERAFARLRAAMPRPTS